MKPSGSTDGHEEIARAATRVSVKSAPLESARVVGSQIYHEHVVRPLEAGEHPELSIDAVVRPNLTVGVMAYSAAVRIDSKALGDAYQVNIPISSTFRTASGEGRGVASVGSAALYTAGRSAVLQGWDRPAKLIALKISGERLRQLASDLRGRRVDRIEFPTTIDLGTVAGREWMSLVRILANPIGEGDRSLGLNAEVGDILETPVLNGLLLLTDAARPNFDASLAIPGHGGGLHAVVEFIDQHAEQSFSVATLASIAGMSVRSLQMAFRDTFDQTPTEYVRAVRLDRVRADLCAPSAQTSTVGAMARRWGFSNMGRFASAYAARFGETPKATLRKFLL